MPPLPPPDIPRSASTRPPHAANRAVPHLRPARAARPPPIRIRCKRLRAVVLRQFVMHPHAIERRYIIRHFDRTFRRSLFDHRQIAFNIHRQSMLNLQPDCSVRLLGNPAGPPHAPSIPKTNRRFTLSPCCWRTTASDSESVATGSRPYKRMTSSRISRSAARTARSNESSSVHSAPAGF